MPVYLLVTCDTKGAEAQFVRAALRARGVAVRLVDVGSLGEPTVVADVPRDEVFRLAGFTPPGTDRGEAVTAAARGAALLIAAAHERGEVDGVLALGGSAGTTIGSAAMRVLPLGVPKLLVSTLASGNTRPFVGDKDILLLNAVVDFAGINRISRRVLGQAVAAMAGMVLGRDATSVVDEGRPLIAATMFGVTTPCVMRAREVLEQAGYEVIVFHATGSGGQAMESLIADGMFAGVLDITTTELADELVGGILTAGPDRLTAAGRAGVPQVISVGALDMVNFGPRETVPEKFATRLFHRHNATVTLMRTTVDENRSLGREIGAKAAAAKGPVEIVLPEHGVSGLDKPGQAFDDPAARKGLYEGIAESARHVPITMVSAHINDALFAETAARRLLELIGTKVGKAV
jgi:uncharacterized protein (UPF0261 family)